ncbi:hypothetical protein DSO57_1023800 [Entomophthora muscae]|uniref:Uncharacterized protein n=2 Tax=Entomophthora muscae TaxID=34485 RepID=A0ACC2S6A0_9FUNG|nr:hypothetical protein DSO57_1019814 [Entomophthora muscae]KAJ9072766.1 hypothetical protein DSO57_1023800 [Entomophthora muscae]
MALSLGNIIGLVEEAGNIFRKPEMIPMKTLLKRPAIDSAKQFAWYTASVACPPDTLRAWSCKSCKIASNTPVSDVVPFKNMTSGASGYVGVDHARKTILVAFRGTNNIDNAIHDLTYDQVPFEDAEDPEVLVHSGFLTSLTSLDSYYMPPLKKALRDPKSRAYTVTLLGISLGACEATLATMRIHHQLGVDWSRINLYAFAPPRTGNLAFARLFNSKPMTATRIVNYSDLVPHFPTAAKYVHIQHQLFVDRSQPNITTRYCDDTVLEDPACSNAISPLRCDALSHFYVWETEFHPIFAC